jgi:hypothetical protein
MRDIFHVGFYALRRSFRSLDRWGTYGTRRSPGALTRGGNCPSSGLYGEVELVRLRELMPS